MSGNVKIDWMDAFSPPYFERTDEPVNGRTVFANFTAARDYALAQARQGRDAAALVVREIQATRARDMDAR